MLIYVWVMKMQCPRCHNNQAQHLYQINGKYYCRECIPFHQVYIDETRETKRMVYPHWDGKYHIGFQLSDKQLSISRQLVENYKNHKDSLILAVCGAGKTEIVFELIQYVLSQGQRVCFCIPRKELVKELYQRIKEAFDIDIGLFYGGCQENREAQLVICTMHQLYRFENSYGFDLMIADEVDAFPFYQNRVLNEIFQRCCLGNYVKMSATFVKEDIHHEEVLYMNRRYHGYDLPVPKVIVAKKYLQKIIITLLLFGLRKKTIIYTPKIDDVHSLVHYLSHYSLKVAGVSSKHSENQKTIEQFKNGQLDVLVSTTLLERGITIEDVQVIIYRGEHSIYQYGTLVQMAGRVGRKPNAPKGHVYILAAYRTKAIQQCIQNIKRSNQMTV